MIREALKNDLKNLKDLYFFLHDEDVTVNEEKSTSIWDQIIDDPNHHIIVAEEDGKLISSCVCIVVPNLSYHSRPYAFIENVVTHPEHRKKGLATGCLNYAKKIAESDNCYKIMLMTGHKDEETLNFYKKAGYNDKDKTAFIHWML